MTVRGTFHAEDLESEIRSAASAVITSCINRERHPSYGYTKRSIRTQWDFLRGMVGLYAVLTEQALNPGGVNPLHIGYVHDYTLGVVQQAFDSMRDL